MKETPFKNNSLRWKHNLKFTMKNWQKEKKISLTFKKKSRKETQLLIESKRIFKL